MVSFIKLLLNLTLMLIATGGSDLMPSNRSNEIDTNNESLSDRITSLIRNTLNMINYEWTEFNHPHTHLLALETNKTLAIIELRQTLTNDRSRSPSDSFEIIDCTIFDMKKRRREGEQFLNVLQEPENNVTFNRYEANYQTVLDALELCRLLWKDQTENSIDPTQSVIKLFIQNIFDSFSGTGEGFNAPGTLWCGPGDRAENYWDLGPEAEIDTCCREHDHCPIRLGKDEADYGAINNNSFTMSLCECDERFKRCIDDTGSYGRKIGWIYSHFVHHCLEPVDEQVNCKQHMEQSTNEQNKIARRSKCSQPKFVVRSINF